MIAPLLSKLLGRLPDMLVAYVTHGLPFFIAHMILAIWILRVVRRMRRETEGLEGWTPQGSEDSDCTKLLGQFLREAKRGADRGLLVPMTDFSDRLDSTVTALVDGLHSRVNLFVVIGIAGTFFALYVFTVETLSVAANTANPTLMQLSPKIKEGLSYAFPVGFFGLVFTLFGHGLAALQEQKLSKALTEATQRALEHRAQMHVQDKPPVTVAVEPSPGMSEALLEALKPAVDSLKETVSSVRETMEVVRTEASATRMLLEGAPEVLHQMNLVVQESRKQLAETRASIAQVAATMDIAVTSWKDAASTLEGVPETVANEFRKNLEGLAEASRQLWQQATQEVIQGLVDIQEGIRLSAKGLQEAAAEVKTVPSQLRTGLEDHFKQATQNLDTRLADMTGAAVQNLTQASQAVLTAADQLAASSHGLRTLPETLRVELAEKLHSAYMEFIRAVQAPARDAAAALQQAAEQIGIVANNVSAIIDHAIRSTLASMVSSTREHLERVDHVLVHRYPEALKSLEVACLKSIEVFKSIQQVAQQIDNAAEQARGASERWDTVNQSLDKSLERVEKVDLPELGRSFEDLGTNVKGIRTSTDLLPGELRRFEADVKEIRQAIERLSKAVQQQPVGIWRRLFG
jgi:uncharacterized coiled-coil DUF342 family protein